MGKYRTLGVDLDRQYRNDLNANFNDIDTDVQAQRKRVDDLIVGTPQPSEVVDARGGKTVLKDRLDAFDTSLADISSFVSIKNYSNLKGAIAGGYDWSPAIAKAITDAQSTNRKIVLHADEDMYITQPIVPSATTKIVGFGKYNSKLKLKGAIKGIDLSSTTAKTGVEISSISIEGTSTTGQIGIDAYYLVNGSSLRDIRIENVDIGLRVTKSWYA
jgi:hypothetical protein